MPAHSSHILHHKSAYGWQQNAQIFRKRKMLFDIFIVKYINKANSKRGLPSSPVDYRSCHLIQKQIFVCAPIHMISLHDFLDLVK
jgi:hypothetical protein